MRQRLLPSFLTLLLILGCAAPPTPTVSAKPSPPPAPTSTRPIELSPTPVAKPTTAALPTATATSAPPATVKPAAPSQPTATAAPAKPVAPVLPTVTAAPPKPSAPTPTVTTWVSGLAVPWGIAFAPDGRALITERPGRIRVVERGQLRAEPWATLDVYERTGSEAGLLGIDVDPQFATNRYVYVAYSYLSGTSVRNRLVRMRDDPATGRGSLDRVLLDDLEGAGNHDGGRVKFGPDGMLYWTVGDTFRDDLAQAPDSNNGKILRITRDGAVPSDNPFPGSPVWSMGHRNPQGLAWQRGTGRLYATEHGPSGGQGSGQDEVNYIEKGKNYGWPTIRGEQRREGLEAPIVQSSAAVTWAPGGATFVSSGPWRGSFLFTGLRGQALYRLTVDPANPRTVTSFETLYGSAYGRLRDVVEGPDGALYILTSNRDGRGSPRPEDDRVLRLSFAS